MNQAAAGSCDNMLLEGTARLFRDHVKPHILASVENGEWPSSLWNAITETGLAGALLPEAAGGYGVPERDALNLLREAGRAGLPVPLAETMLAGWLLAGASLPIPEGPLALITNAAMTLEPCGQRWRLRGSAKDVVWGRAVTAAAALVMVRDRPLVILLRPQDWTLQHATNTAGEPSDRLDFDVLLNGEQISDSTENVGLQQLRGAGAVTRALMMAGALQRITEMTVQYAGERTQFGRPIGRFQAVQQNLAVLAGQSAAATAAADLGVEAFSRGMSLTTIAVAKSRAGEAAGIGARIAHQIHGAIGFTYEHSLHFMTRRLWVWRDDYGGEAEWNMLLGRHLADAGADRLWDEITAL